MNKPTLVWLGALAALPVWMGCADEGPVLAPESAAVLEAAPKLTISAVAVGGTNELKGIRQLPPSAPVVSSLLKFDETLHLGGFDIDWLTVEDSRCPDGVDCVWEGQVGITIAVRQDDEELGTFEIVLHAGDEEDAKVAVGNRVIRLLGVEPYPDIEVETQRADYTARLAIERRWLGPPGLTVSKNEAGGGLGRRDHEKPPRPGPGPGPGPEPPADHTELIETLGQNRALWESQAIARYQFNFSWVCFCIVDFVKQVTITVEDGAITAIADAETGEPEAEERFADYETIDGLFDLVDEAINDKAQRIEIRFNEERGFPESFFIDFSIFIADEERGGEVSGFVVLE